MKRLLENEFTVAHGRLAGSVKVLDSVLPKGLYSLADPAACAACPNFYQMNCNQVVLRLETNGGVHHVEFEHFINGFRRIEGEKCDFLFYDKSQKIVLSDFTCTNSEYVEQHLRDGEIKMGKRAKVRSQIEESIKKLYAVPTIASRISSYPKKIGLFAYRLRDEELSSNLPATLARRKNEFMGEFGALGKRQLALPMSNGFIFVENKYPETYLWGE